MDDSVPGQWLIDPDTRLQLRLKELRAALERGAYEDAVLEAEELLDEEPDYPDALYLLGEALLDADDPEGAVMAFERHIEVAGDDTQSLLRLGLARYEICDLVAAEEVIREVTRREPDHALAHYQLSMVLEAQGRATAAVGSLILANQLDPVSFPLPFPFRDQDWQDAAHDAMLQLHPRLLAVWTDVPIVLHDAPSHADLHSEDPPLSPRTTGMFTGEPPAQADSAAQPLALRLFTRNLGKAMDYEELVEWILAVLEREAMEWLGLEPEDL